MQSAYEFIQLVDNNRLIFATLQDNYILLLLWTKTKYHVFWIAEAR